MTGKRKAIFVVIGLYVVLWIITGTLGNRQVDSQFDRLLAKGSMKFGQPDTDVVRIARPMKLSDIQGNESDIPRIPWRYRGQVVAVAPFVILDEIAYVTAPLGGGAGQCIVFWFFGKIWRVPIPFLWYWNV